MRCLSPILLLAALLSACEAVTAQSVPTDMAMEAVGDRGGGAAPPVSDLEEAAVRGDPAAQYRFGRNLFVGRHVMRDRARAYAQMRLAAMAAYPGAQKALSRMRRRISMADRIEAIGILTAMMPPPAEARDTAPRRTAAWLPTDEPAFDVMPGLRPSPAMIRVAGTSRVHAVRVASRPATARSARWAVQLGAFRIAGAAERHWAALAAKVGGLADLHPRITSIGGIDRLRLTGLDRADAAALCTRIARRGGGCFAIALRSTGGQGLVIS